MTIVTQLTNFATSREKTHPFAPAHATLRVRTNARLHACRAGNDDGVKDAPHWMKDLTKKAIAISAAATVSLSTATGVLAAEAPYNPENLFEAMAYVGRWYEIASLKQGFAGEGQQDCHCTQGIYMPRTLDNGGIGVTVNTFCFHGGPNGRVSGIQGAVSCANPVLLKILPEFQTEFERKEDIAAKCILKFPSLPFIPAEPYNVIETDYDTYALVQGAKDTSFVQIYSRTPNPGKEFLQARLATLEKLGYPVDLIKETPQDCPEVPTKNLMAMMSSGSQMEVMMTNTMDSPFTGDSENFNLAIAGPRNIFSSIKDFFNLTSQNFNSS